MAVIPIDNQSLDFSSEEAIYCRTTGKPFYQIFPKSECTEIEFNLTPETDVELFSNPNFDTTLFCPTDWTCDIAFGNLDSTVLILPTGNVSQAVTLVDGAYYRLCIDILELGGSTALCVTADNAVFDTGTCINELGQFCIYFYASGTSDTFYFSAVGVEGNVLLNSASLKEISLPEISIKTCADVLIAGTTETIETYKDIAKVTFCWEQLDNGCYKMCISPAPETSVNLFDGANNIITNGGRKIQTNSNALITFIP